MTVRHTICAVVCVCSPIVLAQEPSDRLTQEMREKAKKPIVYEVAGMQRVDVAENVKYTKTPAPHLLMDVYSAMGAPPPDRSPAVLLIHGNVPPGSPAKNMGTFRSWGRLVGASGMVGVTFTHRLGYPRPALPDAADDVRAAVEYVRTNADKYGVDKERICLAAFSGGGALLTSVVQGDTAYIRCIVAFYPLFDAVDLSSLEVKRSDGFNSSDSHNRNNAPFAPLLRVISRERPTPIFVARAGSDSTPTLNERLGAFLDEALAQNAPITIANHPSGVHGFDTETNDDRSREIIRLALEFMKTHLGRSHM